MKAYRCTIRNTIKSWYDGAAEIHLLIISEDITSALMYASERRDELVVALEEAKHPDPQDLIITSLTQEYTNVVGHVGIARGCDEGQSRREWAVGIVRRIKKADEL